MRDVAVLCTIRTMAQTHLARAEKAKDGKKSREEGEAEKQKRRKAEKQRSRRKAERREVGEAEKQKSITEKQKSKKALQYIALHYVTLCHTALNYMTRIGAATEHLDKNRERAPTGPVKVAVNPKPCERHLSGVSVVSGISTVIAGSQPVGLAK